MLGGKGGFARELKGGSHEIIAKPVGANHAFTTQGYSTYSHSTLVSPRRGAERRHQRAAQSAAAAARNAAAIAERSVGAHRAAKGGNAQPARIVPNARGAHTSMDASVASAEGSAMLSPARSSIRTAPARCDRQRHAAKSTLEYPASAVDNRPGIPNAAARWTLQPMVVDGGGKGGGKGGEGTRSAWLRADECRPSMDSTVQRFKCVPAHGGQAKARRGGGIHADDIYTAAGGIRP